MPKNKKNLTATGIVGLSALALTVSPALAAPKSSDVEQEKDSHAIVYTVENVGDTFSVEKDDLELPEDIDFSTFSAAIEKDAENVSVEDVLDDKEVKIGEKTVLTIEEQGVWTLESDVEGNLISIDFVPVDGFDKDPVIDYVAQRVEDDESVRGTITLDYPNEEKAEDVQPLSEEELAEIEEAEALEDKEEAPLEETVETVEIKETEEAEETVVEEDAESVDELSDDEEKAPVVRFQARTFAAPAIIAPIAPAAPAPAAPAPAVGLGANFEVPTLTADSDGSPVTLTFGENGKNLPNEVDLSTMTLIIGETTSQEAQLLNNGTEMRIPEIGIFKISEDKNSFTFEPTGDYSGTVTGYYVVSDNIGDFSQAGELIVNVKNAGGNNNTTDPAPVEDSTPVDNTDEVVVDENGNPVDPSEENNDPTIDNGTVDENGNPTENSRSSLSDTGVNAAPAGIIAGVLALFGGGIAFLSSRLRREGN